MTLSETFAKMAKRRLALCMTWQELAKDSGVAEDTIRVWLDPRHRVNAKRRDPLASNLIAVAETLGYEFRLEYRSPPIVNDNINIWRKRHDVSPTL